MQANRFAWDDLLQLSRPSLQAATENRCLPSRHGQYEGMDNDSRQRASVVGVTIQQSPTCLSNSPMSYGRLD